MNDRIFNFSAGPAVIPKPVLEEAREALLDLDGTGIGVMEHSHRGAAFGRVIQDAESACRSLAEIPDDYAVLFLQGGASSQFFMLPANRLPADGTADYLVTGSWAQKAAKEAQLYGRAHVAASSAESNFAVIPSPAETQHSEAPVYVHFTSNNTIFGTQFQQEPAAPGDAWLACDASSDIFSRRLDVTRYGILYAGGQKNLGPSGLTLVIARRDLVGEPVRELPAMLRYDTHAEQGSLYNTPPTFGIYVMGRVLRLLEREGGLAAMEQRNRAKAALLYEAIEQQGFYEGTAGESSRSLMNVTFRTPSADLDARFVTEAEAAGFSGLKGHRSVGGMRASIYNAFPREGCEALAAFMRDFASRNG